MPCVDIFRYCRLYKLLKLQFKLFSVIFVVLFCAVQVFAESLPRYRVVVSTDIGGTDPDDFQSLVHLLLYADTLEIEGLISSPFGPGRKQDILDVIDVYEKDFSQLKKYSDLYPTPDKLRKLSKQGEILRAPYKGYRKSTEGSEWIIKRARAGDPRPLYLLVWGGIEDLAQALHDAPDILPKLRVYWIGGPNKKWSPDAYYYIATHHPKLWIIETNATYRGWFVGGNQSGEWGNQSFVSKSIANNGALGAFFNTHLGGTIKMGDTPSVAWLLGGKPDTPTAPGWGGQFVKAWARSSVRFDRMTTEKDTLEEFGIMELALSVGETLPKNPEAVMKIGNQRLNGFFKNNKVYFRFSPKAANVFSYTLLSNVAELNNKKGAIKALATDPKQAEHPDAHWSNWWVDNPSPLFAEPPHIGIKTVNIWREEFLGDFAKRFARCKP